MNENYRDKLPEIVTQRRVALRLSLIGKISDFGDGPLEFETSEIEELINMVEELEMLIEAILNKPFYCKEWNNVGFICEEQCSKCKNAP